MESLTVPVLKKRLDQLLKIVRYRNSLDGLSNCCVTCKNRFPISQLQCGHFIKRGNLCLKYEPKNLACQCVRCNRYLDGAQDKFAYFIIQEYGVDTLRALVEIDYLWGGGEIPHSLPKKSFVAYYNYWLEANRREEQRWRQKIIPASWKPAE